MFYFSWLSFIIFCSTFEFRFLMKDIFENFKFNKFFKVIFF